MNERDRLNGLTQEMNNYEKLGKRNAGRKGWVRPKIKGKAIRRNLK